MIERHYKTKELANLLGVHPDTLRRAAARGDLEYVRFGNDLLFPESAIREMLERKTNVPRHPSGRPIR